MFVCAGSVPGGRGPSAVCGLPSMAPKGGREPRHPEWLTAMAARVDRVQEEFDRSAGPDIQRSHRNALDGQGIPQPPSPPQAWTSPEPQPGLGIEPTAVPTRRWPPPSHAMADVTGRNDGIQPRAQPQTPIEELAALRLAAATPQGFASWRFSIMVCGRPVVAPWPLG